MISIVLSPCVCINTFAVSSANVTPATVYPALLIIPASFFSCICNGVSRSFSTNEPRCTFPYSVASPTVVTLITPWPSTTVVLRMAMFEGYVASLSKFSSIVVFDITGSPVSVDSFICNELLSISTPSAGTSSPVFSITISPTTTSLREICCTFPLRITVTRMSSFTVFSTSNALAAFTSNIKPMVLASRIAKKMPNGSRNADRPALSGPQQCIPDIIIDNTHANSNILIIGSSNFSRNCFQSDVFSGGVRMFSPCIRRLSSTSCDVRPCSCSFVILYCLIFFLLGKCSLL